MIARSQAGNGRGPRRSSRAALLLDRQAGAARRIPHRQSRVPLSALLLALTVVAPSLAQDEDNWPPYVDITTRWTEINPGGQATLTAEGYDDDGHVSDIAWSATAGSLAAEYDGWYESTAVWTAPTTPT